MTKSGKSTIEIRLADRIASSIGDAIVIRRAWLPMLLWEDVCVEMRTTRGLTMMERFVIECLLRLDWCDLRDLQEIAAIGPELGEWLLTSCVQKKLACSTGNRYRAEKAACERALEQNELPQQVQERIDILCLPETEEFVVLEASSQLLRRLRQIRPSGTFPLPSHWQHVARRDILNRAREDGRLCGEKATACVEFVDHAIIEDCECPAYHASVTLGDVSECDLALTLIGQRAQRKKKQASASGEHDDIGVVGVSLGFPALPRLKDRWKSACAKADTQLRQELENNGLAQIKRHSAGWTASVDTDAADALAAELLLTRTMALDVRMDDMFEFSAPLELIPSSDASHRAFSRDQIVRNVLSAAGERLAAIATEDANVSLLDVRRRLWSLKHFGKVYQLRQDEDFRP